MHLAFDIGGTKFAVVLGLSSGEILGRQSFPSCGPEEAKQKFIEIGSALVSQHSKNRLESCGLSVPGPMSSKRGMLLNPPNLPLWTNVPVGEWIRNAFNVPTAVENDANAAALAEWRWGYKSKVDNLVYLTCGTGMGAGLVLNGKLYRGHEDLAGEIGHVRIRPFGPTGFYKAGSVEGFTSGPGIAKLALIRRDEPHQPSVLDNLNVIDVTGKAVGEAALSGDKFAIAVIKESAEYLGELVAILLDTLNPQVISLGSTAGRLGSLYVDAVRNRAKQEAIPAAFDSCKIAAAALGDQVQDLAALAVAIDAATPQRIG